MRHLLAYQRDATFVVDTLVLLTVCFGVVRPSVALLLPGKLIPQMDARGWLSSAALVASRTLIFFIAMIATSEMLRLVLDKVVRR
jgi:hypothetical protein